METRNTSTEKKKGGKKMTGLIIALSVVAALFLTGAVFCAPFSPVHKAIVAKQNAQSTTSADLNVGK